MLMHRLLVSAILPIARPHAEATHPPSPFPAPKRDATSSRGRLKVDGDSKISVAVPISEAASRRATLLVALHLLNPIVIGISTRGSSESVLTLFVLLTLFCALRGRWDAAAVLLGLSTHWKIYPVIYGVSCVGVIATEHQPDGRNDRPRGTFSGMIEYIDVFVTAKTVRFAVISAGTFFVLGLFMYLM